MKTIGIINPSMVIEPFCPTRVNRAINLLEASGYRVVLGDLMTNTAEIYRSGTISERVSEFHQMLVNPEVDIIMVSIGGQNTASIIDLIDFDLVKANPKIYIGYSDATSLLHAIYTQSKQRVLYGMSLSSSFGEIGYFADEAITNLKKHLANDELTYQQSEFVTNEFLDWESQDREKQKYPNTYTLHNFTEFSGRVVGGNLTTLSILAGSKYLMTRQDNDVLYLETEGTDIGMIEKYLVHLKQIGYFANLSGIILGKTEFIKDYGLNYSLVTMLAEIIPNHQIPIYDGFDAAHTFPSDLIELGKIIRVKADGTITKEKNEISN